MKLLIRLLLCLTPFVSAFVCASGSWVWVDGVALYERNNLGPIWGNDCLGFAMSYRPGADHYEVNWCKFEYGYKLTGSVTLYNYQGTCPDGKEIPTYPNTECTVPPPTCPNQGTFYKSLFGPYAFVGKKSCFPNNCGMTFQQNSDPMAVTWMEDGVERTKFDLFYTGEACSYNAEEKGVVDIDHPFEISPDSPPTGEAPPEDYLPTHEADSPEYNNGSSGGGSGGGTSPNPVPNPDPTAKEQDPELSKGDNAIVGEISISNQHLENITHELERNRDSQTDGVGKMTTYQKHMLGELKKLNTKTFSGGSVIIGDGNGSGSGECNPETEDCSTPVANYNCDTSAPNTFECEGDLILCMQAKIQYENHCVTDHITDLESALKTQFDAIDNEAAIVQEEVVDLSKIDTRYLDNGIKVEGTCPAPIDASYTNPMTGNAEVFSVDYGPFCTFIGWLAPLVVALGWLSGLYVIGRHQGVM
ncbi:hypothetical protein L4C38_09405 [Vibrio kasasachensis]|uniref:virulence factor TspB C-terminal domain-related protein n=1 Tax=Vibrio kasasachensis TaxID=2910248 RepID=UPI003D0FCEEB